MMQAWSLAVTLGGVMVLVVAGIVGLEAQLGAPPQPTRVVVVARSASAPAHPPFRPLAELPVLTPPAFEVASVGPAHNVVAAGMAAPDAIVSVLDGGRELGRVQADASGRWTFSAGVQMAPGGHELELVERAVGAPADRPPTLGVAPMMLVVGDTDLGDAGLGGRGAAWRVGMAPAHHRRQVAGARSSRTARLTLHRPSAI